MAILMPTQDIKQMTAVRTRLKELMEERNLKRMDIVRQANVSYPTIVRWESEALNELDTSVLIGICNVLKCTIDELIYAVYDEE